MSTRKFRKKTLECIRMERLVKEWKNDSISSSSKLEKPVFVAHIVLFFGFLNKRFVTKCCIEKPWTMQCPRKKTTVRQRRPKLRLLFLLTVMWNESELTKKKTSVIGLPSKIAFLKQIRYQKGYCKRSGLS